MGILENMSSGCPQFWGYRHLWPRPDFNVGAAVQTHDLRTDYSANDPTHGTVSPAMILFLGDRVLGS